MPIPFGRLAHSKGGHRMVRGARVTARNEPSSDVVPGASVRSNEVAVSAT